MLKLLTLAAVVCLVFWTSASAQDRYMPSYGIPGVNYPVMLGDFYLAQKNPGSEEARLVDYTLKTDIETLSYAAFEAVSVTGKALFCSPPSMI